ncbi:MAG TPA: hypothetical protein VG518_00590, partial [Solirubrobacterales bacterium]|nr:hypothetical protein [Solirubrobacterales bacterium]
SEDEVALPGAILRHARGAARSGIDHGTLLGHYCAANLLLSEVLIEEAERIGLPRPDLVRLVRALGHFFEDLLAAISRAYLQAEVAPLLAELERRGLSQASGRGGD